MCSIIIPNGNSTKFETMSEHVTTRSISSIRSFYNNNKSKLLCMSKKLATSHNDNDLLAEDGIENSDGLHNGQNIKDGSGIDMEEVVLGENVTTIDIIVGAIARDNANPSVYLATHEDLNSFVQCFFAELKEEIQTKEKQVRIAIVGTFSQDKSGHLVITDQP